MVNVYQRLSHLRKNCNRVLNESLNVVKMHKKRMEYLYIRAKKTKKVDKTFYHMLFCFHKIDKTFYPLRPKGQNILNEQERTEIMSDKRKIIIDCDPGHDDAVAIMLAARNPKIELLGITTVRGNQTIEKVTKNALNVCQYLGIGVPVCKGLGEAIVRQSPPVEERVHGDSGLDGPVFDPLTKQLDPRHAVDFIIETVLNADSPVTLVPTGPLSNIAMAIKKEPKILENIDEIVLMGGAYQHGNVTPAAEFNIYADAEAAHVVFSCGRRVVMMGLDLTRQALCYPEIVERMDKVKTKGGKLFVDLMRFFCMTQKRTFGWAGGPLHDPTTIAYLIDPSCIETKDMYSEIDITGGQSHGRTNCDFFNLMKDKGMNSKVAVKLDVEKFWDIVEDNLKRYDSI